MRKEDPFHESHAISIISDLSKLRPEVASQIIAQFPEFVNLVQSSLLDYKTMLSEIISSDDESLRQVYSIMEKDMDDEALSRQQFYEIAGKINGDLSKYLDNPNITLEEAKEIREQQMEILKVVNEKDTEIRTHKKEIVQMADKKDSEKRQSNWGILSTVSAVIVFVLGFGIGSHRKR